MIGKRSVAAHFRHERVELVDGLVAIE